MDTENNALNQAHAQMDSIRDMVAALEVDYDRLEELRELRTSHDSMGEGFSDIWSDTYADEADELEELEAAAGDCSDLDDAERRILEDALSVEVRSDWHTPGDDSDPVNFNILLCTGGPAVRIMGELDHYGEPCRAWLEYQDWGTPWTERVNQPGDRDALLTYARCFYFGE